MELNTTIARALALAGLIGGLTAAARAQTTTTFGFESDTVGAAPAASGAVTFTVFGDTSVQSTTSFGADAFPGSGSQYLLLTSLDAGNQPFATSAAGATDIATLWSTVYGAQPNLLGSSLSLVSASALQVSVYLGAGSTLSLQGQMFTAEPTNPSLNPYNDAAFVVSSVNGGTASLSTLGTVLGSTFAAAPGSVQAFDSQTNIFTYNFTAVTAGTYTFLLGVGDATQVGVQSGLLVDNLTITAVPEPATTALCAGAAMLALGAACRRMRRSATA